MKFTSTRDGSVTADGATAVVKGVPQGGGLYVPCEFPKVYTSALAALDYSERVHRVLSAFFDFDVSKAAKAYKSDADPAPVVKFDDNAFYLELWHGKTRSYGDLAAAGLPALVKSAQKALGDDTEVLELVAQSGSFGAAALSAFDGADGFKICAMYPTHCGESFQRRETVTAAAENAFAFGVDGNGDDAMKTLRSALYDAELTDALKEKNITLGTANTFNIGVTALQTAYIISAYCDLVGSGEIKSGDKIDLIVPSRELSNALAAFYAQKMGLPLSKIVCVCDGNNAFVDFCNTGTFDINKPIYAAATELFTLSPVNLERIIFEAGGRDSAKCAQRMEQFEKSGRYSVSPDEIDYLRGVFAACSTDGEEALFAAADSFDEYGYLPDPVTAAAYAEAVRREFVRPTVILSIADPFKYAGKLVPVITGGEKCRSELDAVRTLEEELGTDAPQWVVNALSAEEVYKDVVSAEDGVRFIKSKYVDNLR